VDHGRRHHPDFVTNPVKRLGGAWREADRSTRAYWVGLLGVIMLVGGSGWYQAFAAPPYRFTDEQAHTGYVLELQRGHLPTIDTHIDRAHGGKDLQTRLSYDVQRHGDVWVANNPPLPYLIAMGPAAISRAMGLTGGPLLGLRLTNLLFMSLAVAMVARMAANLAGGDRRVGLLAAGILAASPHVGSIAGLAYSDGVAMFASVGMLDALFSLIRKGPTKRQVAILSAWCAAGAATRPMTALLAAAVMAMAGGVILLRWLRDRDLRPGPIWSALVLGLPTLVLAGPWYLRNQHLYGDPTGSKRLLEKFSRTSIPRPGPLSMVHFPSVWRETLRTLFLRRIENQLPTDPISWWPPVKYLVPILLVVAVGIVIWDQLSARRTGGPERTSALAWLAAYAAIVVVTLTIAQHWSGGGTVHARYAFPILWILVVTAALPLSRYLTVWPGVALMVIFMGVQRHEADVANKYFAVKKIGPPNSSLTLPIGPTWWRMGGVGVMLVGLVVVAVCLAFVRPRERTTAAQEPAGA
jgi:4-amino-4-deoxy-L-arabinose transferase-like glycosyltransferase